MRNKLMRTSLLTPIVVALLFVAAGRASAQDMISDLTIDADRPEYVGSCPRDIHLKGKLKVNEGGLGVASVQFVHSDGSASEPVSLTVNEKREYIVEATLRQTNSWSDQVLLRVTVRLPSGPKVFDSSRITIKGDCRQAQAVVVPATVSPFIPPATGRFRVTLTGFVVNHATLEGPFSTDGAGDEVFALVSFAELGASNNISVPVETRTSVRYGDTSGVGPNTLPGIVQAGGASRTGGFRSGDSYPPRVGQPATLPRANAATRARLIPMILWEGELRQGGPNPNAAVIIPTIWESDNTPYERQFWDRQVAAYLGRFASTSGRFVNGMASLKLLQQEDTVFTHIPILIDFDRPIGIKGDTFQPGSVDTRATFVPTVMLLTYSSAEQAASSTSNGTNQGRGVIEITYSDGHNYGEGSYTLFLLVERLP